MPKKANKPQNKYSALTSVGDVLRFLGYLVLNPIEKGLTFGLEKAQNAKKLIEASKISTKSKTKAGKRAEKPLNKSKKLDIEKTDKSEKSSLINYENVFIEAKKIAFLPVTLPQKWRKILKNFVNQSETLYSKIFLGLKSKVELPKFTFRKPVFPKIVLPLAITTGLNKIKALKFEIPKIHFNSLNLPKFNVSNLKTIFNQVKIKLQSKSLSLLTLFPKLTKQAKKVKKPKTTKTIPLKSFKKTTLITFSIIGFALIGYTTYWFAELPNLNTLKEKGSRNSTKILDRNGVLLYEIFIDRKYDQVALDQIPDHVILSTLAAEDSEFYAHKGVRPLSMLRAAKASVLDDDLQGGSTITQQLIKNVLLSPERTLSRKIKEVVLAIRAEQKFTKNELLAMYLNNIPYGGTAWGIQTAAHKYFGKDVWDLNLSESSLLAGLPSAPTAYSPIANFEKAKARQKFVLNRMVVLKYITREEADIAYARDLSFVPQIDEIKAPHFVTMVRSELIDVYGKEFVDFGGLTVTTTLDSELQKEAEQIVSEELAKNKHLNINNAGVVVLDAKNREILAYVGSQNYFEESFGAFDTVLAKRQAGSSLKPVTYALAFEKGMFPGTLIEDSPVVYKNQWETYKPVNYDGKFHGTVTLRSALANSYNIPAVKLVNQLGPDNMVSLAHEMGLEDWEVDGSYGISVTLGGKEVRLLDLANVYGTFSQGGKFQKVTPFISIKDVNGKELFEDDRESKQVLSQDSAYLITSILSDYYARIPAFGTSNYLSVRGHTVAVKTGTTDQKRDNWTVGYTPSYVVGVWVGNNDNKPMNRYLASGLSGAAPIWNRVMTKVLGDSPDEKFVTPEGVYVWHDSKCGKSEVLSKGSAKPKTLCFEEKNDKDKDKDKKKKKD